MKDNAFKVPSGWQKDKFTVCLVVFYTGLLYSASYFAYNGFRIIGR
jgi:hypothetical protein